MISDWLQPDFYVYTYKENILSFLTQYIAFYDTAHAVNTKDLYIICTMLDQRCTNVIQMLYVYWACVFIGRENSGDTMHCHVFGIIVTGDKMF